MILLPASNPAASWRPAATQLRSLLSSEGEAIGLAQQAGGPDHRFQLILKGGPSKLRLGGAFPGYTEALNRYLAYRLLPKHEDCDSGRCSPGSKMGFNTSLQAQLLRVNYQHVQTEFGHLASQ